MHRDPDRSLSLAHLYPNLMNLYGDRGNILCLRRRCEARGIRLDVRELGLGDAFEPGRYDLVFIGGGQDREQWRIGDDLLNLKGNALCEAVEAGLPLLAVCGGYQMLGHYYQGADGKRLLGLGVFDLVTEHPGEHVPRCTGNVEARWEGGDLVGFENHGGRTHLGSGAVALARVTAGFGNNGVDGTEGCRSGNALGTYLHGSLLPKNPALADYLLALALNRKYGSADLPPLDDSVEAAAHAAAAAIARDDARSSSRLRVAKRLWARIGKTHRNRAAADPEQP